MTPNRERVWVGLFVVIAIVVLSGTAIAIWGGFGRSGVPHRTYFKFSGGVQAGSPVRYGGVRIGSVKQVRIDPGDSTRIEIDFVVEPGTPLKVDSVAKLASLSPLSESYLEVTTGTAGAALLPPDSVVNSGESVGFAQLGESIQSLLPQISEVLDKVSRDLDILQVTLAHADDLMNDNNRSNLSQALARANDLLNDHNRSNLSGSLSNLNQMLSESRPKISAGLTGVNDVTTKLLPLLDEWKQTSARADQVLSNLDSVLTENRPDLRMSLAELRVVLANSSNAVDQLHNMMNQNAANLYEILENMRASAVNIRSLTETLKTSPSSVIRGVNVADRKPGGVQK
jgi:phospholipid/cholesterol/gamma-HCH transport system substrate-binding protein